MLISHDKCNIGLPVLSWIWRVTHSVRTICMDKLYHNNSTWVIHTHTHTHIIQFAPGLYCNTLNRLIHEHFSSKCTNNLNFCSILCICKLDIFMLYIWRVVHLFLPRTVSYYLFHHLFVVRMYVSIYVYIYPKKTMWFFIWYFSSVPPWAYDTHG